MDTTPLPPRLAAATPHRRRDELAPTDLAARARALLARLEQPEGPGDHIANAIQLLIAAEMALRELELHDNLDGPATQLQVCLRAATTRCFAALTALMEQTL